MINSKINLNRTNRLIFLALFLICLVFLIFGVKEVYRIDGLYSHDPWRHLHTAEYELENQDFLTNRIKTYQNHFSGIPYPTILYLTTGIAHLLTDIPLMDIYKISGLFVRALTALIIFLAANHLIKSKLAAGLGTILFLSSKYIYYRSLITFPENFAILFFVLIIFFLIKFLEKERLKDLIFVLIFLGASVSFHYRSIIVPLVTVGLGLLGYLIKLIYNKRAKEILNVKGVVIIVSSFLIFALPNLSRAWRQYVGYFSSNIGSSATWKSSALTESQYSSLGFYGYLEQTGIVLLLFSLIGLCVLIRSKRITLPLKLTLALTTVFCFLLTLGPKINLWIPPIRMLSYFCIPLAILASLGISSVLQRHQKIMLFLIPLICINTASVLYITHGYNALHWGELETAKYLTENVKPQKDLVILLDNYYFLENLDIQYYPYIETSKNINTILEKKGALKDNLEIFYPNKTIYLISDDNSLSLNKVFEYKNYSIYKYEHKEN